MTVFRGLAQDPVAHRDNHSRRLEYMQEPARQGQSALRIVPAQQCFNAVNPSGGDVDLRLIVQNELMLVQGTAQTVFERQALRDLAVRLQLIVKIGLSGLLGAFQRGFRALSQSAGVLAIEGIAGNT